MNTAFLVNIRMTHRSNIRLKRIISAGVVDLLPDCQEHYRSKHRSSISNTEQVVYTHRMRVKRSVSTARETEDGSVREGWKGETKHLVP